MLDTIKIALKKSDNGIIISQSVILVLNALKLNKRGYASVEDVTFIINNNSNVYKVTEKQIKTVLVKIASDIKNGYRYHSLMGTIQNVGMDNFQL